MSNIILLENFGSFSYNIVDQFAAKGHHVYVYPNTVPIENIEQKLRQLDEVVIVLSPGQGNPKKAGCMLELIKRQRGKTPIIGIGLGCQAIVEAYGGITIAAEKIIHGKAEPIEHDKKAMFTAFETPIMAACYHALVAKLTDLSDPNLIVNAYTNATIMAVRHDQHRVCGFQFHPESILTPQGTKLMLTTLEWALSPPLESVSHHSRGEK